MGKHSYTSKPHVSSARHGIEAFSRHLPSKGLLGRIALRAGGAVAALTAVGVTLFGVSQYEAAVNKEPIRVSYDATGKADLHLGEAIEEASDDFGHLMGALGAFTILTVTGVALVARDASQRYYRRPEDEQPYGDDPLWFAEQDDPDAPSERPHTLYSRIDSYNDQSLLDELLGEREFEDVYA
jgi:hypothetical protein